MKNLSVLLSASAILITLAGCSSAPTTADKMRANASESQSIADLHNQLAADWEHGHELLLSGKDQVADGEEQISDAESDIEDANDTIKDAQEDIKDAQDEIIEGQENIRLGQRDISQGEHLIQTTEAKFRQAFPDENIEFTLDN